MPLPDSGPKNPSEIALRHAPDRGVSLHHGTVLVDTDLTALQRPGSQGVGGEREGERGTAEQEGWSRTINLVLGFGQPRRYLTPDKRKLQAKGSYLSVSKS